MSVKHIKGLKRDLAQFIEYVNGMIGVYFDNHFHCTSYAEVVYAMKLEIAFLFKNQLATQQKGLSSCMHCKN